MSEPQKCSRCGAELPPDAPGGHCLACLLQLGLEPGKTATGQTADANDATGTARPERRALPLAEKPGDRIGHYKLLQQIGEGGCGVVYMAEQEEPVRRRVALKVIKLGMDTRQVIARFEAERQALAMMEHPNIAKVLDGGATETGRPYFVMELVRGIKITDYCDQQRFSTRQRLELFVQVCQAVQHAHQKGIIHRDLKPSNILVTERDGKAVPKIIDFGIAKATTDQRLTDKTLFTAFEQFIGTPAYMSPEQAGLGGLDIDTRSDTYSLGVLLYELLTGQPPFDAQQLSRSALHEILRVIRETEPPRPSTCLTALQPDELTTVAQCRQIEPAKLPKLLRGDLDWIVMKALEKDRTRRYETANGLARDIQRHLNNEPVVARPPGNLYRFQKFARRNKLALAAAGAIAVSLLGGFGVSTWMFLRERQERQRAVAAEQRAQADEGKAQSEASKSQQVAQFLEDMLKGVGPSVALGRDTKMLKEILDKTAERIGKDLTNQPAVEAELRNTMAQVYEALGEYEKAEAMVREAVRLLKTQPGAVHPKLAASLNTLGLILYDKGDLSGAEATHGEALAMRRKLLGNEHPDVAASLNNLAEVLARQGKFAEAETMHREALAMRRELLGNEHPDVAESLNNLAGVLYRQGKYAEAETLHREALAMWRKLLGNEHPNVAASLNNLAGVLARQGKFAEAETMNREALAMTRKLLGNEHPNVAASLGNLAEVLERQGKFAEAETMQREALAMARKLLGDEHPDVAVSLNNLAVVLARQGKFAEAETLHREALAMRRKLLGNEHPDVARSLNNLAGVLYRQGKYAEAETLHREALAMTRKLLGDEHPDVATSLNNLINLLGSQRKYQEMEQAYNQVLTPAFTSKPQSAGLLRGRAAFFARGGRWKDAAADLIKVIEFGSSNHMDYHSLAPLLAASGDLENYRRYCRESIARFGESQDASIADRMAKACLILPSSGADFLVVSNLAERGVSQGITNASLPWFQCTKSMAEYRQAHYESAADWARKNTENPLLPDEANHFVEAYMVLAMAEYQLKQLDNARAAFTKGTGIADTKLAKLESGDIGTGWRDWIIAHALMDEAKVLIEGSSKTNSVAKTPNRQSLSETNAPEANASQTNSIPR